MPIHAIDHPAVDQNPKCVHSDLFGDVPQTLIDKVEGKHLEDVFLRLLQMRFEVHRGPSWGAQARIIDRAPSRDAQALIHDYMSINDEFRTLVGALYLRLDQQLPKNTREAHTIIADFRQCLWVSLVRRNMNPQKFYALCGSPQSIYGLNVTRLWNLDPKDELVKKWELQSWDRFVQRMALTRDQLMEKEREYRDTAIAITQIGLGLGGMITGLVGLILSILLTIFSLVLTNSRSP